MHRDHGHPSEPAHGHEHGPGQSRAASFRRLGLTLALVSAYMLAELVGGLLTNSLALLADAGHMLSDAASLGLSLFAIWVARRPPTAQRTYGYYRAEILAALVNGAALVAIAGFIFVEAVQRLQSPPRVLGGAMMWIAAGGLLINLAGLAILYGARSESLNVRGAWLHVLGDTLGSVGALAAGALIRAFEWYWADPVASVLIGLLILYSSWRLLQETVGVLMEHAPAHIDVDAVRDRMMAIEGVTGVHDLHVWTITSGLESLSAHVHVRDELPAADVLHRIRQMLRDRFGIDHVTIQLEPEGFAECRAHG